MTLRKEFGIQGEINHKVRRDIQFDEPTHKYCDEDGNNYISATTIIGLYEPEFDKDYWAMYKALQANGYKPYPIVDRRIIKVSNKEYKLQYLYDNEDRVLRDVKVKDILASWDKINKDACERGNEKHNFLEDEINNFSFTSNIRFDDIGDSKKGTFNPDGIVIDKKALYNSKIQAVYPEIYIKLIGLIDAGWTIYAEKRIYTYHYKVAGTIDVLCIRGKEIYLLDWKTNKDPMKFKSGYFKKYQGVPSNEWVDKDDRMKYPLNTLQYCKGMTYTVQLSLYAYICELWGYKIVGLEICHLRGKDRPKFIDIEYRKKEVKKMLTHYAKTKND